MSNSVILIGFIITLCYGTGLRIRLRRQKKFIWSVDPILFLQFLAVLQFWCLTFHSYFIGPYFLSLVLSLVSVTLDKSKVVQDKLFLWGILFPPFISFLSKMEHWWWASYASYTMILAGIIFVIVLFKYPKKIEKELPYLIYFIFDILYTATLLIINHLR